MLNKITYSKSGEYRTGTPDEPLNFFADVLPESKHFDMLLGYFSSSAIRVLAVGFAKFLVNGGHARFIINHVLSEQDKDAILRGGQISDVANDLSFPLNDYEQLKKQLNEEGIHFFNCLAWLIAQKRVQIIAVRAKKGNGIAHQKSGIFSDGVHEVMFKGSCNFTAMALLGNIESLTAKFSWDDHPRDKTAIEEEKIYFNQIFDKRCDFVEYLTIEEVETAIQIDFGNKELDELLTDEQTIIKKQQEKLTTNLKYRSRMEQLEKELKVLRNSPRFPFASGARPYQQEAYRSWVNNHYRGIFAMATGTGKTITALNCVLEEWRKNPENGYQVLILVPTIDLAEQWEKEVAAFNFKRVVIVNSRSDWKDSVSSITAMFKFGSKTSFIIVCSYASFSKDRFQYYFKKLPTQTILIADEAHNMGSTKLLELLPTIKQQKRIGLSATPKRIYDEEGTKELELFFNDEPPYCYSFDVERAIKEGYLCQYRYFPHVVALEEEEFEAYIEISGKLMKFFDIEKGTYKQSDIVTRLLLKRKRIIQKAHNKLAITKAILTKRFQQEGTLKYSFVYVPEGVPNNSNNNDASGDDEEDLRLLHLYADAIANISPSVAVEAFTSQTPNRKQVLEAFKKGDIHVLASMKCLDEGVDIPRTELAVFCASTGNPRQFIQRRGRVLRKHDDKHLAEIHDLIVVPALNHQVMLEKDTFSMERSLVRKELERVVHFAFFAINEYETHKVLEEVCKYYELSLNVIFENLNR